MLDKDKNLTQQIVYDKQAEYEDDEFFIDIGRVLTLFWDKRMFAFKCSFGIAALFLGISFVLPKTYESTTVVQTSNDMSMSGSSALNAMMSLSGGSTNMAAENYIALMQSRTVIEPIVAKEEYKDSFFHSAEENKDRAVAKADKWAEKNLKFENSAGTNLISITASANTPEKAQAIAKEVVDNFLLLETDLNQKQQSLLVKFLEERIKVAYDEATEAAVELSNYQKEYSVYDPSEQAKTAISRMDVYTNTLADLRAKQEATKAELAMSTDQLSSLNYKTEKFQINDNSAVMSIRQKISDQEVELVALRSQYTEEHPSVEKAKATLEQLQKNLAREINAIVASETASMSPQQSELISKKLNAEVNLRVAEVSEQAIKSKYDEEQKKMNEFPEKVQKYVELQQKATLKQSIYSNLVSQAEEAKIKAAKEAMDIQIVDPANLPLEDLPATPNKGKNTGIGFVLGLLIAITRAFYSYFRELKVKTEK